MSQRIILYTVKKGESFHSIARDFKVNVNDLMNLNANYKGGKFVKFTYKQRNFGLDPGDALLVQEQLSTATERSMTDQANKHGRSVTKITVKKTETTERARALAFINQTQRYLSDAGAALTGLEKSISNTDKILFSWGALRQKGTYVFPSHTSHDPVIGRFTVHNVPVNIVFALDGSNPYKFSAPQAKETTRGVNNKLSKLATAADVTEVGIHIVRGDTPAAINKSLEMGRDHVADLGSMGLAGRFCPRPSPSSRSINILTGVCYVGFMVAGQSLADQLSPDYIKWINEYNNAIDKLNKKPNTTDNTPLYGGN